MPETRPRLVVTRPWSTKTLSCVRIVALIAVALTPASGQTTVDAFSTTQATVTAPPSASTAASTGGADILGQDRTVEAVALAGPGPTSATVGGGQLTFAVAATTPDSRGEVTVGWDGNSDPSTFDPTGLGAVDLTAANATGLAVRVASTSAAGVELELRAFTGANNHSLAARLLPAIAAPTDITFSFSEFRDVAGTGADFAAVSAIQLTIRASEATAVLDQVATAGAVLAAVKVDALAIDVGGDGQANPGDRLRYSVTITNTGSEALGLQVQDTVGSNTTFVPGSIDAHPIARPDQYAGFGNVAIAVDGSAGRPGLLANDGDPDGGSVQIEASSFPATSSRGGTLALVDPTLGTFDYDPPVGLAGVDDFTYTVVDDTGNLASTTATITLQGVIWFVDDAHPGANLGTLTDPFVGITAATVGAAAGAGDADGPGDTIFLFAGTYAGGLDLEDGQSLIGEAVGLAIGSEVLVPMGGTPVLTNPAGNGVRVARDNVLRGFDIGNTSGVGLVGTDFGVLTATSLDISGNGAALDLDDGVLDVSLGTLASSAAVDAVDLSNVSGSLAVASGTTISGSTGTAIRIAGSSAAVGLGTVSISSARGIDLSSSPSATLQLASLAATTSAGPGLLGSNGGTLSIAGASNTIAATGGPALDLVSTSLGAGATFSSLSSSTSPGSGVRLQNVSGALTASSGSLTGSSGVAFAVVGGSSSISYGGSITNAAGRSVDITNRSGGSVTLSGTISDTGAGLSISGCSAGNVTLSGGSKTFNTGVSAAISLTNNSGCAIAFTGGGLDIDTTTGIGFAASSGGSVTVSGSGNSVTTTSAKAIDLDQITATMTFATVTASNSPSHGLELTNLANGSAFTVAGAVSASLGAGGTNNIRLANCGSSTIRIGTDGTTPAAVTLGSRRGTALDISGCAGTIELGNLSIPNPNAVGGYGIRVSGSSAAVTAASATISNTVQAVATTDPGGDGIPDTIGDGDAILLDNTTGSFALRGGTLSNLATDGIDCRACRNLTLDGVTITRIGLSSNNPPTVDDAGVFIFNGRGSHLIRNSTISRFEGSAPNANERGLNILQTTGNNFTEIRIDNTDFFNLLASGIRGDDAISYRSEGAVSGAMIVENGTTITNVSGQGIELDPGASAASSGTFAFTLLDSVFTSQFNEGELVQGGVEVQSQGSMNITATIRRSSFTGLGPANANAGVIHFAPQQLAGTFVAIVDDCDIVGTIPAPGAGRTRRGGINLRTGDLANERLAALTFQVNNTDVDNVGDDAIYVDIRGESLTNGVPAGNVLITNNRFGNTTPVGQDGLEGVTLRVRTSPVNVGSKNVNVLIDNNTIRNADNSVGDETFDLDAEIGATINATVTGNTFRSLTGATNNEFSATTEDASSTLCLDLRNNSATQGAGPVGNGTMEAAETAGTLTLRQSGNSPAPTVVGTVGSNSGCPLPTAP